MGVTVLMSVYYKEKSEYLNLAIESIWKHQTLKPTEIILLEDGILTNELYEIIKLWKFKLGPVLKIIKLMENKGLANALNIGIEHCTCDFIARMDSDDISSPHRFEKQVDFLQKNHDIHLVGGSIQEFSDSQDIQIIREYPINTCEAKKYIVKASPLCHATVMFRKSIFEGGIRYPQKYKTSQDVSLWFNLLDLNYKIANIKDIIYSVRISKEFYNRRSRQKSFQEFIIYINGIYRLYGVTWRLFFPLLRFVFRLLPLTLIKYIYSCNFRSKLLN